MLRWLWDTMFVRSQWTIIETVDMYEKVNDSNPVGMKYILQDQWGNIKVKKTY